MLVEIEIPVLNDEHQKVRDNSSALIIALTEG